jgi:5-methylcytosine-specific restriction endonuclease McrA
VLKVKEAAEQKLKVMPAIRWQVFQRDNWKCVACGRNSQDGVILHVDHIIPRSKGGSDTLENYQTLCDLCNIGKSNKDATDLRRHDNIVRGISDRVE